MSLDTFICGLCKVNFSELELFIKHKKKCILTTASTDTLVVKAPSVNTPHLTEETDVQFGEDPENTEAHRPGRPRKSIVFVQTRGRGRPRKGEKKIVPEDAVLKGPEKSATPAQVRGRGRPRKDEEKDVQRDAVSGELLIPVQVRARGRPRKGEEKNVQRDAGELPIPIKSRGRGRPRKGEEKNTVPEESGIPVQVRGRGRPRKGEEKNAQRDALSEELIHVEDDESEEGPDEAVAIGDQEEDDTHVDSTGDKSDNHIQDIPVFNTEEEKSAFEQSLSVDLSAVDNMFRVKVIEQDLNENALSAPRTGPSTYLSLYACNTCDKVFKTLSHMRLHCLTHTNLKPFKCSECSYATSSKGSLYTHMRKHTGQYYVCSQCPFKTVNKSHLVEHVLIHSNVRHRCGICKKDYSSIKSLINHVRSYHSSTKIGQKYLAQFLVGRNVRGDTKVFHECHVCNRKFKRKIDCDRHLFVHNIKDIPCMQRCELCNYAASRRKYLEKHFLKHQVIYCCCMCQNMFVSSVKLLEHITNTHSSTERTCDSILEQSIGSSFYLLPDDITADSSETTTDAPVTTSDSVISDTVSTSVDPMEVEISDQTSDIGKDAETEEVELQGENGDHHMDISENGGIENVTVEVEAEEIDDHSLTAISSHELETANEVDIVTENIMADQDNRTDKSNNDFSSPVSNAVSERLKLQNNNSETENGEVLLIEDDDTSKSTKALDLIKRLGYHPLSVEIFKKMRLTYGTEECEFCGRFFKKHADYEHHVRIHTGDMPFQCDICDYRAMTRITLKRHVEREHDKRTLRLPCKECDFVANDRQQFWNHQRKHQDIAGLECPECHKKFGILKKLRNHILQEHPTMSKRDVQRVAGPGPRKQKTEDMPFQCDLCDYRSMARITLKRHVRREHPAVTMNIPCKECDFVAKNTQQFLNHQRKHQGVSANQKPHVEQDHEKQNFTCKECEFVANSRTQLRNHELKHRGIISGLECPECYQQFKTLRKLRSHILTQHPMNSKKVVQQVPGPSRSKKKKIGNSDTANKTGETPEKESEEEKTKTKQIDVLQPSPLKTDKTPTNKTDKTKTYESNVQQQQSPVKTGNTPSDELLTKDIPTLQRLIT